MVLGDMYEWSGGIFAKKTKFHNAGGPGTVVSPSMQMLQLYFEIIKCKVLSLRIHNQFTTFELSVYLKISLPRMQPGYYLLQVLLILSWKR